MYNTSLNSCVLYFYLADFTFPSFKKEVISLFKNDLQSTDLYKYNFFLKTTYYMHLFLPNGEIINKLPFELKTIDDKENLLKDYYKNLLSYIDIYYKNKAVKKRTSYIGLYISSRPEDNLNPQFLILERERYLSNIKKMHMDLLPAISLVKK